MPVVPDGGGRCISAPVRRAESKGCIGVADPKRMNKSSRSHPGFTLVEIMIVVVIIGLLAAMAIPAFQKVRQRSQDNTVLNNARQLSAAADQYFLENGVTWVSAVALIGSSNYIKQFPHIGSEWYPGSYTQGVTITVSAVGGSRTVTYSP
ncbi:MAG: type II secretion system protein [Opitutales bacterium]